MKVDETTSYRGEQGYWPNFRTSPTKAQNHGLTVFGQTFRSPVQSQSSSPFLQLPAELRVRVLRNLLKSESKELHAGCAVRCAESATFCEDKYHPGNQLLSQISRCCQSLYREGSAILYGENILQIRGATQFHQSTTHGWFCLDGFAEIPDDVCDPNVVDMTMTPFRWNKRMKNNGGDFSGNDFDKDEDEDNATVSDSLKDQFTHSYFNKTAVFEQRGEVEAQSISEEEATYRNAIIAARLRMFRNLTAMKRFQALVVRTHRCVSLIDFFFFRMLRPIVKGKHATVITWSNHFLGTRSLECCRCWDCKTANFDIAGLGPDDWEAKFQIESVAKAATSKLLKRDTIYLMITVRSVFDQSGITPCIDPANDLNLTYRKFKAAATSYRYDEALWHMQEVLKLVRKEVLRDLELDRESREMRIEHSKEQLRKAENDLDEFHQRYRPRVSRVDKIVFRATQKHGLQIEGLKMPASTT